VIESKNWTLNATEVAPLKKFTAACLVRRRLRLHGNSIL